MEWTGQRSAAWSTPHFSFQSSWREVKFGRCGGSFSANSRFGDGQLLGGEIQIDSLDGQLSQRAAGEKQLLERCSTAPHHFFESFYDGAGQRQRLVLEPRPPSLHRTSLFS